MILIYVLIILIMLFIIYTIYDNNRIIVKTKKINIKKLDKEIKILQITDMHSKKLKKKDYDKINNLTYDVIIMTGDMLEDNDLDFNCLKEFMKNINNKKYVLYVDGNNGKTTYDRKSNSITEFGKKLENIGITILKDKYELKINDKNIIFSNFNIVSSVLLDNDRHGKYSIYNYFIDDMNSKKQHINIAVGHYPLTLDGIKKLDKEKSKFYCPDLICAGHYHGGQFRIPFLGAVIIPEYKKMGFKIFPNQKLVSGLYEYKWIKQYISDGIGSSKHFKFLAFRVFNTPCVDLLVLK